MFSHADVTGRCVRGVLLMLLAMATLAQELAALQLPQQQPVLAPALLEDCINQGPTQEPATFEDFASKKPSR
jgi:hypothetical protein